MKENIMKPFRILTQPTDETCGATSFHAIYQYYGYDITLDTVIATMEKSLSGGTLAPLLGKHALGHGFSATVYTNNLKLFDPSWFKKDRCASKDLIQKLRAEKPYHQNSSFIQTSEAFEQFLLAGGKISFRVLSPALLKKYLVKKIPIITGLSSTYLYGSTRERFEHGVSIPDDIQGAPCGHFVVLCDYDTKDRTVSIADPFERNPVAGDHYYHVAIDRLINAIFLGVFTYDGNLLVIHPRKQD